MVVARSASCGLESDQRVPCIRRETESKNGTHKTSARLTRSRGTDMCAVHGISDPMNCSGDGAALYIEMDDNSGIGADSPNSGNLAANSVSRRVYWWTQWTDADADRSHRTNRSATHTDD